MEKSSADFMISFYKGRALVMREDSKTESEKKFYSTVVEIINALKQFLPTDNRDVLTGISTICEVMQKCMIEKDSVASKLFEETLITSLSIEAISMLEKAKKDLELSNKKEDSNNTSSFNSPHDAGHA